MSANLASMRLSRVIRISRPRFWIYELGPYMVGVLGGLIANSYIGAYFHILLVIIFGLYFLIPANIWIYGINDIYDYETDKLNPKKTQ
jgi:lycopene elongase/hydratase (dihydrobisanhydrobacterioruberin-forming)